MKITIFNALLPSLTKEVDFEDFERIDVGIKGKENANHFLWKLWHLFDLQFAPANQSNAPWSYLPHKYYGKKNHVSVLGNINTALGNFQVAISYVRKCDIDSICFYSGIHNDRLTYKKLRDIVLQAKKEINQLERFHYNVELFSKFEQLKIHTYIGRFFKLFSQNQRIYVSFDIICADKYEAYHLGMERMKYLTAFLAAETNILFDYNPIKETIEEYDIKIDSSIYMKNYIDGYSISGDKVLISEEAFRFLDKTIFVERDLHLSHLEEYFLLGCIHIQDGMKEQACFDDNVTRTSPMLSYGLTRIELKDKQEKYTHCVMHYLSAIETASYEEGNHEVCEACGNIKFKIGSRVKDFISKYFDEDLGKVFKSLYAVRSKYLHTGILSTSGDFLNVRPLIDDGTELGLVDNSFISVKVNGGIAIVYVSNIKEWTTFALRCFYHEKMYGNMNHEVEAVYNDNSEAYIPHFSDPVIKTDIEGMELIAIEPT